MCVCVSSQLLDACQLAPTVLINVKCKERLEAFREAIRHIYIHILDIVLLGENLLSKIVPSKTSRDL